MVKHYTPIQYTGEHRNGVPSFWLNNDSLLTLTSNEFHWKKVNVVATVSPRYGIYCILCKTEILFVRHNVFDRTNAYSVQGIEWTRNLIIVKLHK